MKSTKNVSDKMLILSTLFIMVANSASAAFNVCMANFAENFPEAGVTGIRMILSRNSLCGLIVVLALGPIIGKKFKFRSAFLIGLGIPTIANIARMFFLDNYTIFSILSLISGFGSAFLIFTQTSLLFNFGPDKGSKLLALSNTVALVANVIVQNITGIIVDINLFNLVYIYIIGIVGFIITALFFKDRKPEQPETVVEAKAVEKKPFWESIKLPGRFWVYMLMMFMVYFLAGPVTGNYSFIIVNGGYGGAADAARVFSCYMISFAITGIVYPKVSAFLGRFTLPLGFSTYAIAAASLGFGKNMLLFCAAYVVMGFGHGITTPTLYKYSGTVCKPDQMGLMGSLMSSAAYISGYIMPYWYILLSFGTGDLVFLPTKITAFICLAFVMILFIINPVPKELRKNGKTEVK